MEVDLNLATSQLDSLVVSYSTTVMLPLFIYLILGLTLGRVILFPITDRVDTFISYSTTFQCESNGYNNTARGR